MLQTLDHGLRFQVIGIVRFESRYEDVRIHVELLHAAHHLSLPSPTSSAAVFGPLKTSAASRSNSASEIFSASSTISSNPSPANNSGCSSKWSSIISLSASLLFLYPLAFTNLSIFSFVSFSTFTL